jgi:hypothetical protein
MGTTTVTPTLYHDLDAKLPIVMLPVRIETRYFAAGADLELRVRIFPSSAHVTTDRPSPDQVEHDETVAYWTVRETNGDTSPATVAAWQRITSMFGDARAQWLRRTLAPTKNADGSLTFPSVTVTPATTDGSFLASQATALPTRFLVSGFAGTQRVFNQAGQPTPDTVSVGPHGDPNAIAWQTDFKAAEAIGLAIRVPITRAVATKLTRIYVYGVREAAASSTSPTALADLLQRHIRGDGASLMPPGTPTNNTTDDPAPTPPLASDKTPISGTDGFRIAQALGVDAGIFAGIGGSDAVTDSLVTSMHLALWPATVEYFLKQVMAPVVDSTTAVRLQSQFQSYVRPAGPFPSLRLGSQPYGILPVTSSANWMTAAGTVDPVMKGLHTLASQWLTASAHAPRVGATSDAGSDVISVLSQSPVSRRWTGRVTESHLVAGRDFVGADAAKYTATVTNLQKQKRDAELTPLGITATPLALDFIFRGSTFDINAPLVAPVDADRAAPLPANYLAAMATATADALNKETITGASPHTLLYMFLRHSTLLLLANTASTILTKPPIAEAVFVESTADTVWTRLNTPVAALGNKTIAQALSATLVSTVPTNNAALLAVKLHQQALNALAKAPVGVLERLTAGAIDAASFRLDAWITAQATDRLHSMRTATPAGLHLGAYAWVDAPALPATAPADGAAPFADPTSEGFVHGARLEHARTAAILRAAWLSRNQAGAQAAYAIDLSSDRVRLAKQIVAEVQGGANLAELLGARVERLMIENNLGPQLSTLRTQFPLDSGDGRQRINGVALVQAWQKTAPASNLQPVSTPLLAAVDALGDLLLAEAIHQQASGSAVRARTALSGLETGIAMPADFDVTRTQPDAVNTVWRLVLPIADTGFDSWIAGLVGDPAQLTASIAQSSGAPKTATLASLGITAKGLLDFAQESPEAPALAAKFSDASGGGGVTFSPQLENALVVSYALSLLLRNARPLSSADLGDIARTPITDFDAAAKRRQWLHDLGRVRQPIQALGLLDAVLTARGSSLTLKFASAGPQLTLVTIGDWPDASATGTLFDGWNEITPGLQAATGVAVHYDAPRSRPPQAILLLVPPSPTAGWDVFGVEAILAETADLAKIRMVRPSDVHGSFLPALYFADNLQSDTVSTDFLQIAYIAEVKQ